MNNVRLSFLKSIQSKCEKLWGYPVTDVSLNPTTNELTISIAVKPPQHIEYIKFNCTIQNNTPIIRPPTPAFQSNDHDWVLMHGKWEYMKIRNARNNIFKQKLLAVFEHLHDSRDIDTDYVTVNQLVHLYLDDLNLITVDPSKI